MSKNKEEGDLKKIRGCMRSEAQRDQGNVNKEERADDRSRIRCKGNREVRAIQVSYSWWRRMRKRMVEEKCGK